jgi:hypothetical protein
VYSFVYTLPISIEKAAVSLLPISGIKGIQASSLEKPEIKQFFWQTLQ